MLLKSASGISILFHVFTELTESETDDDGSPFPVIIDIARLPSDVDT